MAEHRKSKIPGQGNPARPVAAPVPEAHGRHGRPLDQPGPPVPASQPGSPARGGTPRGGQPGFVQKTGRGALNVAKSAKFGQKSNGAAVLLVMAFGGITLWLAKERGGASINGFAAVGAMMFLTFVLMAVQKVAPGVGIAFAGLILLEIIITYGAEAYNGIFAYKGTAPVAAPIANDTQVASSATALVLSYIGYKAGIDALSNLGKGPTIVQPGQSGDEETTEGDASSEGSTAAGEGEGILGEVEGVAGDVAGGVAEVAGGVADAATGGAD
jgi:hypothetical protein